MCGTFKILFVSQFAGVVAFCVNCLSKSAAFEGKLGKLCVKLCEMACSGTAAILVNF
jgi:hypothetical protein